VSRLLFAAAALVLPPGAVTPAPGAELLVFAAASLKDALDEQVAGFERGGARRARVAYGASSTLAKQIENGAPAQVFISADIEWMEYLAARNRIDPKSRVNLLANRLVLVAPAASGVEVEIAPGFPLDRLLAEGRLAIADPDHVPAGRYGRAALEALGIWQRVSGRTAPADNVRAALALVARGEAPLGIVYRTDALEEKRVRIVAEFPASTHPPIVYPAAVTATGRTSIGPEFLAFLRSPAGRAVWERHGFAMAP
jgi:molybdate transport system substrate-binding protein